MLTKFAIKLSDESVVSFSDGQVLFNYIISNDLTDNYISGYIDSDDIFYDNKAALTYAYAQGQLKDGFDLTNTPTLSPFDLKDFPK